MTKNALPFMPNGWKKNVGKRNISRYEKFGGSSRQKSNSHGNASRKNCSMCSLGVGRASTKLKGCLKEQGKGRMIDDRLEDIEIDEVSSCFVDEISTAPSNNMSDHMFVAFHKRDQSVLSEMKSDVDWEIVSLGTVYSFE